MPQNDSGKLNREQNADVLAYLLSLDEFPAGKTELAHEAELLKQIGSRRPNQTATTTNRRHSVVRAMLSRSGAKFVVSRAEEAYDAQR